MKNLSVTQLGASLSRFLSKYHVAVYSLTVVISVSIAILMLNGLLSITAEEPARNNTTLDKQTLKKIDQFQTRDSADAPLQLPAGRVNPFAE